MLNNFTLYHVFCAEHVNTTDTLDRLVFWKMQPPGSYPFQCDKTIPCKDLPHQVSTTILSSVNLKARLFLHLHIRVLTVKSA